MASVKVRQVCKSRSRGEGPCAAWLARRGHFTRDGQCCCCCCCFAKSTDCSGFADSAPFRYSTPPPRNARFTNRRIGTSTLFPCASAIYWELPSCEAASPFSCWLCQTHADLLRRPRFKQELNDHRGNRRRRFLEDRPAVSHAAPMLLACGLNLKTPTIIILTSVSPGNAHRGAFSCQEASETGLATLRSPPCT